MKPLLFRLLPLMLLFLLAGPAWASASCCGSKVGWGGDGPEGRLAESSARDGWALAAVGLALEAVVSEGDGCACCPEGVDCEKSRCCGSAAAGSMLAGPPPFRIVLSPAFRVGCVSLPPLRTRTIGRDARPPIDL